MRSDTTSPSLLSRVRETGNRTAWREFDAKYGELILRYARRFGLQHADAEDVRQMVMARLFRALGTFRYSPLRGRFRSFLARIVSHEISRYKSRPIHQPGPLLPYDGQEFHVPATPAADAGWEHEWMNHHLRLAAQRLRRIHDPRSLEVFDHLLAGESVCEVAAHFDMTAQAVHKIKQRIRERLKKLIAEQIREEDQFHG